MFILELLGLKPKFSDSLSNIAEKYNRLASVHAPAMQGHEPSLLKLLAMSPKSSVAIVTCLPVVYYGYLQSTMLLPVVYYGYLQSSMATCSLLWLPVVYYGYL